MNKIKKHKKIIIIVLLVIMLLLIDQILKNIVLNQDVEFINNSKIIIREESRDGVFGVGQKDTISFVVTNFVVIGIIVKFMSVQEKQIDKKTYAVLILIIAGAFGNFIDRIVRGYVLKIFSIGSLTFNLADTFIVVGWIMLAMFIAIRTYKLKEKKEDKVE